MCSSHEIQATINSIGFLEEGEYFKGKDCSNALKDLTRYLKRDDPNEKTIRRELLKSDVISNDLIPLLKIIKPKKESALFDIVLRLLVNLTQSALNCFELKIPEDKFHYNIFLEIDNQLKRVKESFADEGFIRVLSDKISEIMRKEWQDRPEEEELILERILFLIRNVLLIKNSESDENRLETDINSHDHLILNFFKTDLTNHLIYIAHSNINIKYTIHILEIVTLMLREQSPEELAKVSENEVNLNSKRSQVEKEKDIDELEMLTRKDSQMRKHNRLRLNPRHSRFMGTYVAVNMKSINDENKLIVHKNAKNMDEVLDDSSKKIIRKAKNKIVFENDEQQRKSVLYIRIILKKFCLNFVQDAYNTFFRNLKDLIQRKKLEDDETCYYYWLIQFLTEFTRNSDFQEQQKIELIKETFSLELFHSIEVFIQRCFEMMRVEKENNKLWAKRMHTSLKCYKENLVTLFALEKKIADFDLKESYKEANRLSSIDTNVNLDDEDQLVDLAEKTLDPDTQSSISTKKHLLDEKIMDLVQRLKDQIFYIQEFRELFITMLKDFDHTKMSKNFLRDLIEANHIFVLMLEAYKKNGTLSIGLKKKKRKTKKKDNKKSKKKETKEEKEKRLKEEEEYNRRLDEQDSSFKTKVWQKNFARVASLIQGQSEFSIENDNLMPFDFVATSDEDFESHKDLVIEKIQHLLVENKPDDSVSLFREARFLFLRDKDLFGTPDMAADDEFETFKNLFMKELDIKKPEPKESEKNDDENEEIKKSSKEHDEGLGDDFDDEANAEETDAVYNEEFETETNDEAPGGYVVEEENLDFEKFLFRYTHPHILKSYILMLGEYGKNSDFLNRCCMAMFERIAYECHAPQCLYQLSFFNLINKIFKDPMSRCCMNILEKSTQKKSIDDLYASTYSTEDMFSFFRQLLSKFFEQTTKNPLMYLEILFFKDKKIIFDLGEESTGYQSLNADNLNGKNRKIAWTQEEQDELKELFEKYKKRFERDNDNDDDNNLDDDIEDVYNSKNQDAGDIIDLIMLNIKDGNRKRKDLCNQLVNIGCVKSADVFKTEKYTFPGRKKMGRNKLWRDEDIADLRHSFFIISDEAKELDKPLSEMMNKLQTCLKINRTKSCIVDKLLSLGLIKNKSELMGSKKKNKNKFDDEDDKFIQDDDSDVEKIAKKKEKKKSKKKKSDKKSDNDLFDAESESSDEDDDDEDNENSSLSESEPEIEKNANKEMEVLRDSDKSDKENSPVKIKLKGPGTRDRVLESLGLNEDLDEGEMKKSRKSKSRLVLSDDSEDENISRKKSGDKVLEDLLMMNDDSNDSVKLKTKKQKSKKVLSDKDSSEDDDDDDEDKSLRKRKSVAKKRKKIIDSNDEDSRNSIDSKNDVKSNESLESKKLEKKKVSLESDSDEESDDDLPLGSMISSKRPKLFLSEDDE
ncbi:unnamed protein product [Brachionus calyciflorus]|uniref:Timeless N-terminal domain-containing protein n=1 Tax=Brachionus calyciflorus TaxID=104777 RepID=A0A813M4I3_9BILA|nr:unnamed protein product [Brachionus calyciflorus]